MIAEKCPVIIFSSDATFFTVLSSKMEAMEEVKKMHDELVSRSRRTLAVTFFVGLVIGGIIIAFVILKPSAAPQFKFGLMSSLLSFLVEWKQVLFCLIAFLSIGIGIFSVRKSFR